MPVPTVFEPKVVIGLMSGTSVDGIDAVCARLSMSTDPETHGPQLDHWEILGTHSAPYTPSLQTQLLNLMQAPTVSLAELGRLHMAVSEAFGHVARTLMDQMTAQGVSVDFVASHGQTVGHFPPSSGALGSTLQLGEPSVIATLTGLPLVADFRPGDMAVGGQGAPLVPFADLLLFGHPTEHRAVQNIGGIANLTLVPATQSRIKPMAFDSGPGNMAIDALMRHFYNQPYDKAGTIAAQGTVNASLLEVLLEDPYFSALPPKSTGRERYGQPFVESLLARWPIPLSPEDWVATLTRLTADTMAAAYQQFVLPQVPLKTVIVGGGGTQNPTLMRWFEESMTLLGVSVTTHETYGIPSQYKEALAFALLGYGRWFNLATNIPACTGAQADVSLGGIWHPPHNCKVLLRAV